MSRSSPSTPESNLEALANKPYIGDLIVVGFLGNTAVHALVLGAVPSEAPTWKLAKEEATTVASDNLNETTFRVMDYKGSLHVVSNGEQTALAIDFFASQRSFREAMEQIAPKSDIYHTPRVSAVTDMNSRAVLTGIKLGVSIVRDSRSGSHIEREFVTSASILNYELGFGYAIHTYSGYDLSPYRGKPFPFPIKDNPADMVALLQEAINNPNVAIAVKVVQPSGKIDIDTKDATHDSL